MSSVPVFNLTPVFCAHNGVAVMSQNKSTVVIGMTDVHNTDLRLRIERAFDVCCAGMSGQQPALVFEAVSADCYSSALARMYAHALSAQSSSGQDCAQAAVCVDVRAVSHEPVVQLLDSLFIDAVSAGASDIHIEPFGSVCRVRIRRCGELRFHLDLCIESAAAVVSRIKFLAGLDIAETRRAQDGRFSYTCMSKNIDVRVSTVPVFTGESAVLRLLDTACGARSLESLGFTPNQLDVLQTIMAMRSQLVLVCGSTGSGKSTTLAAVIQRMACAGLKIITVEDPVEYVIEGATQIPVNESCGVMFETVLANIFRQDPDVIMIGEIRSLETAEAAVRAALTGHLVLATLHTSDAGTAAARLLDLGIAPYLVSSVLSYIIAQRLEPSSAGEGLTLAASIVECGTSFKQLVMRCAGAHEFQSHIEQARLCV